jgi:hypothetical protein
MGAARIFFQPQPFLKNPLISSFFPFDCPGQLGKDLFKMKEGIGKTIEKCDGKVKEKRKFGIRAILGKGLKKWPDFG